MRYDGISKPEEKTENKTENGLLEAIESSFDVWLSSTITNLYPFDLIFKIKDNETDALFDEAFNLVKSLKLPKEITGEKYFSVIWKMDEKYKHHMPYAGLFYSALMKAGVEKLTVPAQFRNFGYWGYRMQRGILEVLADSWHIGGCVTGGVIINKGNISFDFGRETEGGIFINYGSTGYFGWRGNGMFINYGIVEWMMGYKASGEFINLNAVKDMGDSATGGVYITTKPVATFLRFANNAYGVEPLQLEKDKTLCQMLGELQCINTNKAQHILSIESAVKKIKAYCIMNYGIR